MKTNQTNNKTTEPGYWDELDRIERHKDIGPPLPRDWYSKRDPKLTPREQIRKWLDEDMERAKKNA